MDPYPPPNTIDRAPKKIKDTLSAKWDTEKHLVFLDLCEEEIQKGNRPGSSFSRIGWANLCKGFEERTKQAYTKLQLKNHWDVTKKEWILFRNLMRGESGIGWDPIRKTIDANAQWWEAKIATNKEYQKFHGKDLSLYWFRYDAIFADIAAIGFRAQATTEIDATGDQGSVPLEDDNEEEECDSIKSNDLNDPIQFESCSLVKKRKATVSTSTQAKQKVSGAATLRESICDLVEIMKSRSTGGTSAPPPEGPTIHDCVHTVNGFPEESLTMEARFHGLMKLKERDNREIFFGLPTEEHRIRFIQYLWNEDHK